MPGLFCPGFRHDDFPSTCDASELHGSNGVAIWHPACAHFDHLSEADSPRGETEEEHEAISPSHCRRRKRTNRGAALPWAWLLVASLLLAIVLGTSQPLPAQPGELRTVTMRLAADDTYRAQPNWEANLRATVATVSAIYERNFQIRFVILDIVPWTTGGLTAERSLLT